MPELSRICRDYQEYVGIIKDMAELSKICRNFPSDYSLWVFTSNIPCGTDRHSGYFDFLVGVSVVKSLNLEGIWTWRVRDLFLLSDRDSALTTGEVGGCGCSAISEQAANSARQSSCCSGFNSQLDCSPPAWGCGLWVSSSKTVTTSGWGSQPPMVIAVTAKFSSSECIIL